MFSTLRLWLLGIGAAGLLGLLATAGWHVWHQGYEAAERRCALEKAAQEEANRLAVQRAEQSLLKRADELSLKNKELDDALDALDAEMARAAGDDGDCRFGPERLRRLSIPTVR